MSFIKELAVCLVVVLSIIEFDIIFQDYFYNQKCEIEEKIKKVAEDLGKKEKNEENVRSLYDKWFNFEYKAAYFIEHDELEKVSQRVSTIKKSVEIEEFEEAEIYLEEISFLINHIYEKDKMKLKNIF